MLFEGMSKGLLNGREVPTRAIDRVRAAIEREARMRHFEAPFFRWGVYQKDLLHDVIDDWWGGVRLFADVKCSFRRDLLESLPCSSNPRDVYTSAVLPLLPAAIDAVTGAPMRRLPALDPTHAQMAVCAAYLELERLCGEVALGVSPETARATLSEASALAAGIAWTCGSAPDASLLDVWGSDTVGDGVPTYDVEADGELLECLRSVDSEVTLDLRPALEDVPWPEGACEALARDVLRGERALFAWRGTGYPTLLDWAMPVPDLDPCRVTLAEVIAASRTPVVPATTHAERDSTLSVTRESARGLAAYCDVAAVLASRVGRVEGDAVWLRQWMPPVSGSSLDDLRGKLRSIGGDPWQAVP